MDTASFRMAFQRFQAIRGQCVYLRSDAGSNFMGARNTGELEVDLENAISQTRQRWNYEGKIWDINPPLASHFGGVWEREIGKVRSVIQGYLSQKDDRLLNREEFMTLLYHAASIVNSTPLWSISDSADEPQPVSPQMLLTQRDDACRIPDNTPPAFTAKDIAAYGANRWKRVEVLAEQFWVEWQEYLFEIGRKREKWPEPKPNARIGDLVLLIEKNTPRLEWPIGRITHVTEDNDGLVRRVIVQPQRRPNQPGTEKPRERAISDLILLKDVLSYEQEENHESPQPPKLTHAASVLFTSTYYNPTDYGFEANAEFSVDDVFQE